MSDTNDSAKRKIILPGRKTVRSKAAIRKAVMAAKQARSAAQTKTTDDTGSSPPSVKKARKGPAKSKKR